MRIESLTAEMAGIYRKDIAWFYYKNSRLCSCLSHYTYEEAYMKISSLMNHLVDHTATAYGAFDGEEIIGFIWAYVHQFREELRMYVNEIRVKEEYRNQGIGSQLLKMVEEKAKEQGIKVLYLHAEANNLEAIRLYQKCGYSYERIQLKKEVAQ
jgi:ribosomal protein S18 acetylase RimI-like enzyme